MELDHKVIKELSAIVVIIIFGVLVFLAVKPILLAIAWGMLLAYVFLPVYRWLNKRTKNEVFSASIVLILLIVIIVLPILFVLPDIFQQIFELYKSSQALDLKGFIDNILPSASPQLVISVSAAINTVLGNMTSSILNFLVGLTLDIPLIFIDLFVVAFVFFFTLKDVEKIKEFVKTISPLNRSQEKMLVEQFKDITYSTVYGRFVVGLVQGLLAGIGFLVFGVTNALVLTIVALFLAVLPILGVYLIWIPVAIYMFATSNIIVAILFTLYNLIIVSNVDNVLMAYIVSRRTSLSPLMALISSLGGLFLFGIIGLVIGPLIFAYFIILLDLYRNGNLLSLFSAEEQPVAEKKS
ncbi:AI-2E family transporter [Candidatus Pacearchaeota archaeon]|nr:AI-2E family transporter [Candidatus Pacearchaeota archaeon]